MSPFQHAGSSGGVAVMAGPIQANPDIISFSSGAGAAVTTALKPTFTPVKPPAASMVLAGLGTRIATGVAASTVGVAIYSIVYSAANTYSASLIAQLNAAAASTTSNAIAKGQITTGAAGSGTGTVLLDFTQNQYVVGVMASTVTTLQLTTITPIAGLGTLSWTDTARSSTTDWPSSFTQTSGVAGGSAKLAHSFLYTADGLNWL